MKFFVIVIFLGILAGLTPSHSWAQETQVIPSQSSDTQQNISTGDEGTAGEFGKGSVDFTWLFLKTMLAMLVVISLAVVSLRFFLPRLTWNRQIKGRTSFKILDRIPLDTKKGLYVVEVEGRRLLLGAAENHVSLIAELENIEEENG